MKVIISQNTITWSENTSECISITTKRTLTKHFHTTGTKKLWNIFQSIAFDTSKDAALKRCSVINWLTVNSFRIINLSTSYSNVIITSACYTIVIINTLTRLVVVSSTHIYKDHEKKVKDNIRKKLFILSLISCQQHSKKKLVHI